MRVVGCVCILGFALLGLTGCRSTAERAGTPGQPEGSARAIPTPEQPVMLPANTLAGRIASVYTAGRFVVITFPIGQMPALDQRLNVYRNGLKVGEVKVTGPQRDDSIVADIAAGEALPGDQVRP
jgi:hypothetical protein